MAVTTAVPAGYQVAEIETATVGDDVLAQIVALWTALESEAMPEDPPRPFEVHAARFRTTSPMFRRRQWGAWADGKLAGAVSLVKNESGSNAHIREVGVMVLPEHRRRGLGRGLLAVAIDAIGEGEGEKTSLIGWTRSRVPAGGAFAERVGAKAALRMRTSQLGLGRVDHALMQEWAALDPAGYRLEWIDGDVPDRLMDNVMTAWRTMNTMPREGLEVEDWKVTPDHVRDSDRMRAERGSRHLMLLAIHEATGATVSFTDVAWEPRIPHEIHQRGTATVPEHRDRGLGKWVKARMLLRILEEQPEARVIRTDNAGTNAPMLAINTKMGFEPAWENIAWQVPLADARRYVGS